MKLGQYSINKTESPEGESKVCKGCNVEKSIDNFAIDNHLRTTNRRGKCKDCYNKKERERHHANRERNLARRKELRDRDPESYKRSQRQYRKTNHEKSKQYQREYVRSHREMANKYRRKRKQTDQSYKLRIAISSQIREGLKQRGLSKNRLSAFIYLSYTIQDLVQHIESKFEFWMAWDNWGWYNPETWDDDEPTTWTWHIDHIIPQSQFNYISMDDPQFAECWSLNNLRPYPSKLNVLEGLNRTRHSLN